MEQIDLTATAKEYLAHILDMPGEVIYSSKDTLRKGDIYLMGLNPGGDEPKTIREHLDQMMSRENNAYLDESWKNGIAQFELGQAPLQRRIKWLIESLGYDVRDVCATNLIFNTSKSAEGVCFGLAGLCWRFHEHLLDIIQPRVIITFGNSVTSASPYYFLRSLFFKGSKEDDKQIEAGQGNGYCRSFKADINGRATVIIGLPHLSRYNIIGKDHVVDWVKQYLDG